MTRPYDPTAVRELLDRIEATRPAWAGMPPWEAEKIIERRFHERQTMLFGDDKNLPGPKFDA